MVDSKTASYQVKQSFCKLGYRHFHEDDDDDEGSEMQFISFPSWQHYASSLSTLPQLVEKCFFYQLETCSLL